MNDPRLTIPAAKLRTDGDELIRRYLTAGTETIAAATKGLERKLEAATLAAVGGKLWRAWQSSAFPKSGPARNPAGTIWIKGGERTRGAITYLTKPGQARPKDGGFFAVPLPAAGPQGRGRLITPAQWEAKTGIELRPVFRRGRAPILVADSAVLSGRKQVARRNTDRRIAAGRGSATVPIFVLLSMFKFSNTVSVEKLVSAARATLPREYVAAINKVA